MLAASTLFPVSPASAQQSAPSQPAAVDVTRAGTVLTASWDAPAGAAKYHVVYSSDGKNSWTAAAGPDDNHTAATIDITGIDVTKSYIVGVRAGNAHGWSGWRNSAPTASESPPGRPGAITVARAAGTMTASWAAATGATKYHVTYSSNNGSSWSAAAGPDDNHTAATIDITAADALTYIVAVRAGKDIGGTTLWSAWRNSTSSGSVGPPAAPAQISTQRVCDTKFSFNWTPVPGATGYDLVASYTNRKSWQRMATNTTATGGHFTSWQKNKTYYLAVRARNAHGTSAWTNSAAAPAPNCWVGAAANPKATTSTTHGTSGGAITTTWDAGQGATAYNINYKAGGQWTRIASNHTATTHTGTVTDTAATAFAVQSIGNGTTSQWRNANISWLTASDLLATSATLTITGHGGSWHVKETSPATDATCSSAISGATHALTTLSASTTYTHTAYNDAACAEVIGSTTFTTTAPGSPAAPTVTLTAGQRQLTVTWTAPNADGLTITDYDVQYRKSGATDWTDLTHAGTAVTAAITGLEGAETYEVRVRAENSEGEGTWGTASLATNAGLPDAPAAPTLTPSSTTQVTVTWTAPHNGGVALDSFDVQYKRTADSTWSSHTFSSSGSTTSTTVGSLTSGTSYDFQVRAGNTLGDSPWSATATEAPSGPPAPPAAPALTTGNAQLGVAWTAPASGGSAITDYDMQYRAQGTSEWDNAWISPANYNPGSRGTNKRSNGPAGAALDLGPVSLSGLTVTKVTTGGISNVYKISESIGALRVRLRAKNARQGSVTYRAAYATTAPTTSNMNTHGTELWAKSAGYTNYFTGDTTVHAVFPANTHFWIAATTDNRVDFPTPIIEADAATVPSTLTSTISGLTNGTTYEVQLAARNANGLGAWAPSGTLKAGLPAQSAAPTIVSGDQQLTASWSATSGNGSNITDYDVEYSTDNGATWTEWAASTTSTARSVTITGLQNDSFYVVRVRATNTHGDGLWGPASASTEIGAPEAVAAPTVTPTSTSQLTVTWAAPNSRGSAITAYEVEYSTDGSTWSDSNVTVTLSTRTAGITGLSANTAYRVRVRAENARGKGGWSRATTIATITAGNFSHNSATLTIARGSHTGDWYVKKTAPTPAGSCSGAISGTTHNLTSLTRNTTYTYTAYSDSSCSTAIGITSFSTLPSTLSASASNTTATLTINHHTGNWYVKATSSGANCSGASSTSTHSLSSLTDGKKYTYHAYSDSSCSTMIARGSQFATTLYAPINFSHEITDNLGFNNEHRARWNRNSNTTGDVGYQLQQKRTDTNSNWADLHWVSPGTGGVDPSLSHTTTLSGFRDFRVRAYRGDGSNRVYSAWVQ